MTHHRAEYRTDGAVLADSQGVATPYAIFHLQDRGTILVKPGTPVYEGMVVGEYSRDVDLDANLTKEKKLSGMRATGHDEATIITPPREMGLDPRSTGSPRTRWSRRRPRACACGRSF